MKTRTRSSSLVLVAASLAAGGAQAHDRGCGLATLRGLYVFSASGFNIVQGVAQPKAITEFIRFNGDGTLVVGGATVSQNGTITRSPPGGLGTYTVAPDCTGTLQFGPPGPAFDLFVSPGGYTLHMNQTGGAVPGVLQGRVERVSR